MMKANNQLGFININEDSIDEIIKDGEVIFERGFLREKTSTTLPIAFGGVGKDLKDYKIYGNIKQQILPDGYTQVDYIESSGTQYIDTGIKGNNNTLINLKIKVNSRSNVMHLLGDITDTSKAISFNLGSSTTPKSRWGNLEKNIAFPVNTTDLFEITLSEEGYYFDKTIYWNPTHNDFETENNMFLFSANGSTSNKFDGRIYSCKVYDNNVLARDFIPCYRNSDNEVGLYDLVNNVFYTNQGTGVFTYGSVAPTPDAPIEMVSCGDKTNNMFDFDNIISAYYSSVNQTKKNAMNINYTNDTITFTSFSNDSFFPTVYNGVDKIDNVNIPVKPNTNYSILYDYNRSGIESVIIYALNETTQKYVGLSATDITGGRTFNTGNYSQICIRFGTRNDNGNVCVISNICLKESATGNTYEPYGYKIPVNFAYDNLFDKNNYEYITAYLNSSNIITSSSGATSFYIKCKPNTTYTVSKSQLFTNDRFCLFDTASIPTIGDTALNYVGIRSGENTSKKLTITTNSNANYLCVFIQASPSRPQATKDQIANTLQIVETINIYLDEPLRKINEYSDYIDFINGKVVRNISEYKITGNENWQKQYGNNLFDAQDLFNDKPFIPSYGLCNMYKYNSVQSGIDTNTVNGEFALQKTYYATTGLKKYNLFIKNTSYSDKDLFKTYLQNLYNNNTPVIINYPLETPTEESIILPNIPTIDGNNTLNIETEITPSQVYIKYKSNT